MNNEDRNSKQELLERLLEEQQETNRRLKKIHVLLCWTLLPALIAFVIGLIVQIFDMGFVTIFGK